MLHQGTIWVGTGAQPVRLSPAMANRHGLIAGATGTGKTVTLKVLAEGFSDLGVPVFLSDVKGDLSGLALPGAHSDALAARLAACGVQQFPYQAYPTVLWDLDGEHGHPVRATVSEMGPVLLSRLLNLNDTQAGVLNILFRVADEQGMLLVDTKDLQAMLTYLGEHASEYTLRYGHVSAASIGAIQRAVLALEAQGGDCFFGEPALNIADWLRQDETGRGVINLLDARQLIQRPDCYAAFLLWMLSELYELLPEQGDTDKPRMVFFFDEAHLLFDLCGKVLLEKVEQVVRLIRSKGVGIYFCTQNPADIPMSILSQLGNRVQHALRAFTPLDQKGVRAAAQTFRPNPAFDTGEAITSLATGEALVSFLDASGIPAPVERAIILPPQSFLGALSDAQRTQLRAESPLQGVYEQAFDRVSAYEMLCEALRQEEQEAPPAFKRYDAASGGYTSAMTPPAQPSAPQSLPVMVYDPATGQYVRQMMALRQDPATGQYVAAAPAPQENARARQAQERAERERLVEERRRRADELREERAARARRNDSILGRIRNTAISTVSREVTRTLTRGILGSLTGRRR